jgi:hypothetical protein
MCTCRSDCIAVCALDESGNFLQRSMLLDGVKSIGDSFDCRALNPRGGSTTLARRDIGRRHVPHPDDSAIEQEV